MKNILITGVAGLLGSNFAEHLINKGINVIGIDDLSGGYVENINELDIVFVKADLVTLPQDELNKIIKDNQIDTIYHFAAYAAEGLSPFIRKFNYDNNLIVTAKLINSAIKFNIDKFVFTSSMAVYGANAVPFHEELIPNPIDPYGVAKYACEMDLRIAGDQHGLNWTIIRPHNVFGKKQNIWDRYRNVLGIWMYQNLNNEPITIYGDGLQTRAFTYMDNILEPLFVAGNDNNSNRQIINLGGSVETPLLDVANYMNDELFDNKSEIIFLEQRHEVKHAFPTYRKSIERLDYKEEIDIYSGLKIMYEWAKEQPIRNRFKWQEYEITEKIYSYWS